MIKLFFFLPTLWHNVNNQQYKPAQKGYQCSQDKVKNREKADKEVFHGEKACKGGQPNPLLPPCPNNTLREQTSKPLHQPRAYQSCHIWMKMGGADGMEIPSLSSLLLLMQILFPRGPNHSYMFLFTLLLPKWDNPACRLTQSLMLTGHFFFFQKSTGRPQRWSALVWWGEKKCCVWVLYLWQHLILLTGKVQCFFWKSEIFSSWSTQSSRTKSWSVLNKKRCWVKRFYRDSCFSSSHTPSLLKMSEKKRWCSKQKPSGHKA